MTDHRYTHSFLPHTTRFGTIRCEVCGQAEAYGNHTRRNFALGIDPAPVWNVSLPNSRLDSEDTMTNTDNTSAAWTPDKGWHDVTEDERKALQAKAVQRITRGKQITEWQDDTDDPDDWGDRWVALKEQYPEHDCIEEATDDPDFMDQIVSVEDYNELKDDRDALAAELQGIADSRRRNGDEWAARDLEAVIEVRTHS